MAAEDIENPGSSDGDDGNPNKDAKSAAAKPCQLPTQFRRHPGKTCVAGLGMAIAIVVYIASAFLFGTNYDSPSHPTRAAGVAVGIIGVVSGGCLMVIFFAIYAIIYPIFEQHMPCLLVF
jgi:hypothetical protein